MEENEKPKSNDGCFNGGCLIGNIIIAICIIVGGVMLSDFHDFQYLGYIIIGLAIAAGLFFLVRHILNVSQTNDETIIDKKHNNEEDDAKNYNPNKTKEPQENTSESTKGCILIVIAAIVGLVLFTLAIKIENFASIIGILAFAGITLYLGYRFYNMDK